MKQYLKLFGLIALLALCFSFKETYSPPPSGSVVFSALRESNVWQCAVKDVSQQVAQSIYNNNYAAYVADVNSAGGKRCVFAQEILTSRVGDYQLNRIVNYFTNPAFLTNLNDSEDTLSQLAFHLEANFDKIAKISTE